MLTIVHVLYSVAPFNTMKEREQPAVSENPGKSSFQNSSSFKKLIMFARSIRSWLVRCREDQGRVDREGHDVQLFLH